MSFGEKFLPAEMKRWRMKAKLRILKIKVFSLDSAFIV